MRKLLSYLSIFLFLTTFTLTLNLHNWLDIPIKNEFGWRNLLLAMFRFPIFFSIGAQSFAMYLLSASLAFYFFTKATSAFLASNNSAFVIWFYRLLGYLLLLSICDFCYWDVSREYFNLVWIHLRVNIILLVLNVLAYLSNYIVFLNLNLSKKNSV